jgi:hypothetical protein
MTDALTLLTWTQLKPESVCRAVVNTPQSEFGRESQESMGTGTREKEQERL